MTNTAVVILNYNGANYLQQFLPSVIAYSGDAQIIVADNKSTDNSLELLHHQFPGVTLIELDQNYGYAGGYNKALAQIDSTYVVLLNSDVEVTENWLNEHGFKFHSLLMGKPRGGNYHWIDNHLVKATRYKGKFTDLVEKDVTIEVFKD